MATTGGLLFGELDFTYREEPGKLRKTLAERWKFSPSPKAKFITAEPVDNVNTRAELRQRATYFVDEFKSLGAYAVAVYSFQPKAYIHAVIWPDRKWRHTKIKDALARIGLKLCGNPTKAIQSVSTTRQDKNKALWLYLSGHVERLPGPM